jgi:hypothetical protein
MVIDIVLYNIQTAQATSQTRKDITRCLEELNKKLSEIGKFTSIF